MELRQPAGERDQSCNPITFSSSRAEQDMPILRRDAPVWMARLLTSGLSIARFIPARVSAWILMIIRASRRFACTHRFVVKRHGRDFSFVCRQCHVRKDELPVVRWRPGGRLIAFPSAGLDNWPETPDHAQRFRAQEADGRCVV